MLLQQLVGVGGDRATFTFGYTLLMSQVAEVYTWVFERCEEFYGQAACEAVHWIMADEDSGQNVALANAINVCIRELSNVVHIHLPHSSE